MVDKVMLDDNAVSWQSLRLFIECVNSHAGGRFYGYKSFNTGEESRPRTLVKGQKKSGVAIAQSAGDYTAPEPKITWLLHAALADEQSGFDSFISMLKQSSEDGISYGNVKMYWNLQSIEGSVVTSYEYFDVFVKSRSGAFDGGEEGLVEEWTYSCKYMLINGGALFDATEGI
jgi:hypothetical protein